MTTIEERFQPVRCIITDIDGILTDGKLYYNDHGECHKVFHAHDGSAIRQFIARGYRMIAISGRRSKINETRLMPLGFDDILQGVDDKASCLQPILDKYQLTPDACCFIGDDIIDVGIMQQVGLAISVRNARPAAKQGAHWVLPIKGGRGVFAYMYDHLFAEDGT